MKCAQMCWCEVAAKDRKKIRICIKFLSVLWFAVSPCVGVSTRQVCFVCLSGRVVAFAVGYSLSFDCQ